MGALKRGPPTRRRRNYEGNSTQEERFKKMISQAETDWQKRKRLQRKTEKLGFRCFDGDEGVVLGITMKWKKTHGYIYGFFFSFLFIFPWRNFTVSFCGTQDTMTFGTCPMFGLESG